MTIPKIIVVTVRISFFLIEFSNLELSGCTLLGIIESH